MCIHCEPAEKYSVICPNCGIYLPPLEIAGDLSLDQLQTLEELTRSFRNARYELDATPKDDPLYPKLYTVACQLLEDRINLILEA
ncbi:MAG: hypothetical protein B655_1579 [Methanobacterium sp. Maddingley MBC34]|nr:MAG: hypothetical protein B655_1579 [Methanobacterium sp. Maddingley MBC34]